MATTEQWQRLEHSRRAHGDCDASCILELRDRLAALEGKA